MEKIFVDTSAIYALISGDETQAGQAVPAWEAILERGSTLITNNYVLVEAISLLQNRTGLASVHAFRSSIMPFLQVVWIDEKIHSAIMNHLLSANRRQLSLVDCSSFETMRQLGIEQVFTFDEHFGEQGFTVIP
ncbi:MAG: VapC toxin family PIN domain ribonuclease [Chloroflexi bacterium]|nr:VapC toxin family PIN domain ribonuclease [Chloroflexota bacterium]MDL1942216.1 PIN domain-containing protein [Chloroflexi bacterium CFX2]